METANDVISFRFSLTRSQRAQASSLDLGHVAISGDRGAISSEDKCPDQAMMLYLSLPDLLSCALDVTVGGHDYAEFRGTDSSFFATFKRRKCGIEVGGRGVVVSCPNPSDLLHSLDEALSRFLADPNTMPSSNEAGMSDLLRSTADFRRAVATFEAS